MSAKSISLFVIVFPKESEVRCYVVLATFNQKYLPVLGSGDYGIDLCLIALMKIT